MRIHFFSASKNLPCIDSPGGSYKMPLSHSVSVTIDTVDGCEILHPKDSEETL